MTGKIGGPEPRRFEYKPVAQRLTRFERMQEWFYTTRLYKAISSLYSLFVTSQEPKPTVYESFKSRAFVDQTQNFEELEKHLGELETQIEHADALDLRQLEYVLANVREDIKVLHLRGRLFPQNHEGGLTAEEGRFNSLLDTLNKLTNNLDMKIQQLRVSSEVFKPVISDLMRFCDGKTVDRRALKNNLASLKNINPRLFLQLAFLIREQYSNSARLTQIYLLFKDVNNSFDLKKFDSILVSLANYCENKTTSMQNFYSDLQELKTNNPELFKILVNTLNDKYSTKEKIQKLMLFDSVLICLDLGLPYNANIRGQFEPIITGLNKYCVLRNIDDADLKNLYSSLDELKKSNPQLYSKFVQYYQEKHASNNDALLLLDELLVNINKGITVEEFNPVFPDLLKEYEGIDIDKNALYSKLVQLKNKDITLLDELVKKFYENYSNSREKLNGYLVCVYIELGELNQNADGVKLVLNLITHCEGHKVYDNFYADLLQLRNCDDQLFERIIIFLKQQKYSSNKEALALIHELEYNIENKVIDFKPIISDLMNYCNGILTGVKPNDLYLRLLDLKKSDRVLFDKLVGYLEKEYPLGTRNGNLLRELLIHVNRGEKQFKPILSELENCCEDSKKIEGLHSLLLDIDTDLFTQTAELLKSRYSPDSKGMKTLDEMRNREGLLKEVKGLTTNPNHQITLIKLVRYCLGEPMVDIEKTPMQDRTEKKENEKLEDLVTSLNTLRLENKSLYESLFSGKGLPAHLQEFLPKSKGILEIEALLSNRSNRMALTGGFSVTMERGRGGELVPIVVISEEHGDKTRDLLAYAIGEGYGSGAEAKATKKLIMDLSTLDSRIAEAIFNQHLAAYKDTANPYLIQQRERILYIQSMVRLKNLQLPGREEKLNLANLSDEDLQTVLQPLQGKIPVYDRIGQILAPVLINRDSVVRIVDFWDKNEGQENNSGFSKKEIATIRAIAEGLRRTSATNLQKLFEYNPFLFLTDGELDSFKEALSSGKPLTEQNQQILALLILQFPQFLDNYSFLSPSKKAVVDRIMVYLTDNLKVEDLRRGLQKLLTPILEEKIPEETAYIARLKESLNAVLIMDPNLLFGNLESFAKDTKNLKMPDRLIASLSNFRSKFPELYEKKIQELLRDETMKDRISEIDAIIQGGSPDEIRKKRTEGDLEKYVNGKQVNIKELITDLRNLNPSLRNEIIAGFFHRYPAGPAAKKVLYIQAMATLESVRFPGYGLGLPQFSREDPDAFLNELRGDIPFSKNSPIAQILAPFFINRDVRESVLRIVDFWIENGGQENDSGFSKEQVDTLKAIASGLREVSSQNLQKLFESNPFLFLTDTELASLLKNEKLSEQEERIRGLIILQLPKLMDQYKDLTSQQRAVVDRIVDLLAAKGSNQLKNALTEHLSRVKDVIKGDVNIQELEKILAAAMFQNPTTLFAELEKYAKNPQNVNYDRLLFSLANLRRKDVSQYSESMKGLMDHNASFPTIQSLIQEADVFIQEMSLIEFQARKDFLKYIHNEEINTQELIRNLKSLSQERRRLFFDDFMSEHGQDQIIVRRILKFEARVEVPDFGEALQVIDALQFPDLEPGLPKFTKADSESFARTIQGNEVPKGLIAKFLSQILINKNLKEAIITIADQLEKRENMEALSVYHSFSKDQIATLKAIANELKKADKKLLENNPFLFLPDNELASFSEALLRDTQLSEEHQRILGRLLLQFPQLMVKYSELRPEQKAVLDSILVFFERMPKIKPGLMGLRSPIIEKDKLNETIQRIQSALTDALEKAQAQKQERNIALLKSIPVKLKPLAEEIVQFVYGEKGAETIDSLVVKINVLSLSERKDIFKKLLEALPEDSKNPILLEARNRILALQKSAEEITSQKTYEEALGEIRTAMASAQSGNVEQRIAKIHLQFVIHRDALKIVVDYWKKHPKQENQTGLAQDLIPSMKTISSDLEKTTAQGLQKLIQKTPFLLLTDPELNNFKSALASGQKLTKENQQILGLLVLQLPHLMAIYYTDLSEGQQKVLDQILEYLKVKKLKPNDSNFETNLVKLIPVLALGTNDLRNVGYFKSLQMALKKPDQLKDPLTSEGPLQGPLSSNVRGFPVEDKDCMITNLITLKMYNPELYNQIIQKLQMERNIERNPTALANIPQLEAEIQQRIEQNRAS